MQQRFLQLLQRRELLPVEGIEALGFFEGLIEDGGNTLLFGNRDRNTNGFAMNIISVQCWHSRAAGKSPQIKMIE